MKCTPNCDANVCMKWSFHWCSIDIFHDEHDDDDDDDDDDDIWNYAVDPLTLFTVNICRLLISFMAIKNH